MALQELRKNVMMSHLIDSLEAGKDIGHYGRLVFAMVARHFVPENELSDLLCKEPGFSTEQAHSLIRQVQGHDYSPPRPDKIHHWQSQQQFPICPNVEDPDACNVYKDLKFPQEIYQHIGGYYEHKP